MDTETLVKNVFVARQPIFERSKNVFGYELLFRSGLSNVYDSNQASTATLAVIANSFLSIGLDDLIGSKRGFVNFTRELLLRDVPSLLPSLQVGVELPADLVPDEPVIAACRKLKGAGYVLALDDFGANDARRPLLPVVDLVKVNFLRAGADARRRIAADLVSHPVKALAMRIETAEDFDDAAACGYSYYQGYFFSKPVIQRGREISGNNLVYLRMVGEVNRPDLSYDELEALIKQDVSLTYKLLRFINSAWFGLRYQVKSIRHALVLLGPAEIRKWFALVALRHIGTDKPTELLLRSMTRARMGELLAPLVGMQGKGPELFLLGMFSAIDALLDMPMADILPKLPLDEQLRAALAGTPSPYRTVYNAILAYEHGDWDLFSECAAELRLDENRVPDLFRESLRWAYQAFGTE